MTSLQTSLQLSSRRRVLIAVTAAITMLMDFGGTPSANAMERHTCKLSSRHSPHVRLLQVWGSSCGVAKAIAKQARSDWGKAYLSDAGRATTGAYSVPTGHSNPSRRYFDCRWSWDAPDRMYDVDCLAEGPFHEVSFFISGVRGP